MSLGGGAVDGHVRLDLQSRDAPALPAFLKYAPLGLASNGSATRPHVANVGRDEARWDERPVRVVDASWKAFERWGQRQAGRVGVTSVAPLEYRWALGRSVRLASGAAESTVLKCNRN
ncbi:MAG: hypothetical protein ACYDDF_00285 [Thermoplasmatota archaeon]